MVKGSCRKIKTIPMQNILAGTLPNENKPAFLNVPTKRPNCERGLIWLDNLCRRISSIPIQNIILGTMPRCADGQYMKKGKCLPVASKKSEKCEAEKIFVDGRCRKVG
ncbi:uncharacterized protein LOC115626620 [Scaptodrosophila lebanonensis]|uniref:Uncharacterized protein LOC115626620 n=1 Tax=Drosophila lebanonensis TaxID=7225 RepID=A0A6J2TSI4_DROLE|nr:uncharacterized protein LOC115626620 [Scaptodrosophila lebanonensis]